VAVGGQRRGEQVVGGAVEVVAAAVVAPGRAGVGVAERVLDVLERSAEAQALGGIGVPQAVRCDAGRKLGRAAESAELLVGELVEESRLKPCRPLFIVRHEVSY
jgi:hypothetical protein